MDTISVQIILVTGASGFVGTNLTERLLKEGCAVIALDQAAPRRDYPGYRCVEDIEAVDGDFDLCTITGDIRDKELLQEVFRHEIQYVVHLAAVSTIQMGMADCRETMSVNVDGTNALLYAATASGKIKGFLYASTDKVYGRLQAQAYTEEDALCPLEFPYDISKARADQAVREWALRYGQHGIVLRFCNIYGKYDLQQTRIVPATVRAVLEDRDCLLRMYCDKEGQVQNFQRDFLYVADLCRAIWYIICELERCNTAGSAGQALWGEAFNLGSGCGYFMNEIIQKIQIAAGKKSGLLIEISTEEMELTRQCMDCSKAKNVFGFEPETSLEKGLQETVDWWMRRYAAGGLHDQ